MSDTENNLSHQFPSRLYEMLENVEKAGLDSIISWLPGGKSFKVHDRDLFVDRIMKCYFKQSKYKSFQRQLNLWGFQRMKQGTHNDKGAYFHPSFVRGSPELCLSMSRTKINGRGSSIPKDPPPPPSAVPSSKSKAPNVQVGRTPDKVPEASSSTSAKMTGLNPMEALLAQQQAATTSPLLAKYLAEQADGENKKNHLKNVLTPDSAASNSGLGGTSPNQLNDLWRAMQAGGAGLSNGGMLQNRPGLNLQQSHTDQLNQLLLAQMGLDHLPFGVSGMQSDISAKLGLHQDALVAALLAQQNPMLAALSGTQQSLGMLDKLRAEAWMGNRAAPLAEMMNPGLPGSHDQISALFAAKRIGEDAALLQGLLGSQGVPLQQSALLSQEEQLRTLLALQHNPQLASLLGNSTPKGAPSQMTQVEALRLLSGGQGIPSGARPHGSDLAMDAKDIEKLLMARQQAPQQRAPSNPSDFEALLLAASKANAENASSDK